VQVTYTVPSVVLSANSLSSIVTQQAGLTWVATNATSCAASQGALGDGWGGNLALQGAQSVTELTIGPIAYTVTCSAATLNSSATVTVNFLAPSAVLSVAVSPITLGQPATVTWSSNADSCTPSGGAAGDGWNGSLPVNGTKAITEAASGVYSYKLTCAAGTYTATANATLTVTVPSVTLSATPASMTVGQSTILNWSSSNATACTGSGGTSGDGWTGARALAGTLTVTPASANTYSYAISCIAATQSAQAQSSVTVSAPRSGGGGAFDRITLLVLAFCVLFGAVARADGLPPRSPPG
jgi:hypothetical protein